MSPPPLSVTYGTIKPATTGQSNGSITATTVSGGTGPYTASWSPSSVPNPTSYGAKTGLAAGSYTLTITSADSQTSNHTFTITSVAPLVIYPGSVTHETIGASTVSGGSTPITGAWASSTGGSTSNLNGINGGTVTKPGKYTLTVTDVNGRTATYEFVVKAQKKVYKTAYGSRQR